MAPEMHNARVVQAEDGRWELLWADDQGNEQSAGPFDTADAASAELVKLRTELAAKDEAGDGA